MGTSRITAIQALRASLCSPHWLGATQEVLHELHKGDAVEQEDAWA